MTKKTRRKLLRSMNKREYGTVKNGDLGQQLMHIINVTAFDMEILEHEQWRKRSKLASRGMDVEMKEVEKTVRGLKRSIFIQIQKPKLPKKQHPEKGKPETC